MKKTKSLTFTFLGKEVNYKCPILGQATIRVPNDIMLDNYGAKDLFNSMSQATRYRAYKRAKVKPCEVNGIIFL